LCGSVSTGWANVITEWDENAVAMVAQMPPFTGERWMAMVHAAMFDALNAIDQRYHAAYLVRLPADSSTSKEAAATSAATTILVTIDPKTAEKAGALAQNYLASIPDGKAKSDGIKLGEAVATRLLQARVKDGSDALDDYRPSTAPGVYVPTTIPVCSTFAGMKPFGIVTASQFRPEPPPALSSKEWSTAFNEVKDYGGKGSTKRTAQQTETARFWLMVGAPAYHPFARQLVTARHMDLVESARFMALVAIGLTDAWIAVCDAKYHYDFWRPITAIRNADIDDNSATDRESTWQPLDATPMFPEYPAAHAILAGTLSGVVKAEFGSDTIPEVAITSLTAPGVTHRWTDMAPFAEEIANARIWAGFHYRFSTRAGTEMGRRIGEYVSKNVMRTTPP
jgi:hypothetical protein